MEENQSMDKHTENVKLLIDSCQAGEAVQFNEGWGGSGDALRKHLTWPCRSGKPSEKCCLTKSQIGGEQGSREHPRQRAQICTGPLGGGSRQGEDLRVLITWPRGDGGEGREH